MYVVIPEICTVSNENGYYGYSSNVSNTTMATTIMHLTCSRGTSASNLNRYTDELSDVIIRSSGRNANSFRLIRSGSFSVHCSSMLCF